MKTANWKDTAELIGITAIVASLIFVGLQMKQARDIAISDGNLANAANKIERNNAIIENPVIWAKGSSGGKLDENDAVVFRNLVRNVYDVAFFEAARMSRLGADNIAAVLMADFSAFLFNNPGARRVWMEEDQETTKYRNLLLLDQTRNFDIFTGTVISNFAELDQMQN